jgi:hypothetical protein
MNKYNFSKSIKDWQRQFFKTVPLQRTHFEVPSILLSVKSVKQR